jgi:glyoxylase-like metal-dependent hydrolase (beta-lactamase superfamily II)
MRRFSTIHAAPFVVFAAALTLVACSKKDEPAQPTAAAPAPAPTPAPEPAPQSAPAPAVQAPAAKQANFHEFRIGELTAVALRDGYLEFPNDLKIFGLGHTVEEVNAVLAPAGLPTAKLKLDIHPLLVRSKDRVLLFDAGPASLFGPTAGKIANALADASVAADSVTDIFISHSHGDHIGGVVDAQGALVFPNATIHLSKQEWEFMSGQESYAPMVAAITPKVDAFAPDAELVPGVVKAVEIRGHTPGHSGYRITSGAASLLYVGDSMHHFVLSVQKADWPMSFDVDQVLAAKSRAALIADSAARSQRIYAVHFPFPGLGKFEARDEGFVWVAE